MKQLFFIISLLAIVLYLGSTSPVRNSIQNETKPANKVIRKLTRIIRPQFEEMQGKNVTVFTPVCYYAGLPWTHIQRWGIFYWIKVIHDDGIAHIKVRHCEYAIENNFFADISIVDFRQASSLEEDLPIF